MVYQYQPVNPLNAFAQSFNLLRGIQDDNARRQQEQVAQQQAMQRQRDLQGAIANLRMNPSPEAIAEFGLMFPEMKEQIDGYYKTLDTAKQNTQKQAMGEVIIAQRTGQLDQIPVILERYAVAAENSRDPVLAKEFRDAVEFAKANPEAAAETARLRFGMIDPDGYKTLFDTGIDLDTSQIKNLIAEGLQPGTPEFQAALREERTKVSFFHPEYGYVSGSPEFVQSVFGGSTPADTEKLPRITTKEGYDALAPGQKYIGPDGKPYQKAGGAGSNASGNF